MKKKAPYTPPMPVPPRAPRPPMTDEQIAAMTRLTDPDYARKVAGAQAPEDVVVEIVSEPAPAELPEPQEAPATTKTEVETAQHTNQPEKTPQTALKRVQEASANLPKAKDVAQEKFPWDDLTGIKAKTNLLFEIPADVVAKMDWVCNTLPKMSKQRIVREAVNAELARIIAEHYKP